MESYKNRRQRRGARSIRAPLQALTTWAHNDVRARHIETPGAKAVHTVAICPKVHVTVTQALNRGFLNQCHASQWRLDPALMYRRNSIW